MFIYKCIYATSCKYEYLKQEHDNNENSRTQNEAKHSYSISASRNIKTHGGAGGAAAVELTKRPIH